jgi:hypothetical protein
VGRLWRDRIRLRRLDEAILELSLFGFTGDNRSNGEIESFDALFYGMSDWGTWYQGEILGNFVATNSNLETHAFRLRVEPDESWKINLIGMIFELDEFATRTPAPHRRSARGVDSGQGPASELDLIVDWEVGEHLTLTATFGALFQIEGSSRPRAGTTRGSTGCSTHPCRSEDRLPTSFRWRLCCACRFPRRVLSRIDHGRPQCSESRACGDIASPWHEPCSSIVGRMRPETWVLP